MDKWLIDCANEERACEMKKKKKREEEGIESDYVRENIKKIMICKATVIVHIYTVTVAVLYIYTLLQALM